MLHDLEAIPTGQVFCVFELPGILIFESLAVIGTH
jgi:hypothetical protein